VASVRPAAKFGTGIVDRTELVAVSITAICDVFPATVAAPSPTVNLVQVSPISRAESIPTP
jgi:hypothetical protein